MLALGSTNHENPPQILTAKALIDTYLVEDAIFTFGRRDWNGTFRSAEEVHAMSLANLDGEYCTVVRTLEALEALSGRNG